MQKQLEASASTNAMLRTTTALTMAHAGNKENVLPGQAEATRELPPSAWGHRDQVVERTRALVADATHSGKFELHALPGGAEASRSRPPTLRSTPHQPHRARVFPERWWRPFDDWRSDSIHFGEISDHIF